MPQGPRAVVIPFGVPAEARGLGLGLAALVHGFTQIDQRSVALAQLLSKKEEGSGPTAPVEAFVSPQAWRDLAGSGNAPPDVAVVVTGAFEPPQGGRGLIQLLAFDARDGATRAKVELHVDEPHAGQTFVAALSEVWSKLDGELGSMRDLSDLGWDALESVLRGERCLLHDPARSGAYDRLAAMMHFGRAVDEAPDARFPAGRLAAVALESAMMPAGDARLAGAALRALTRAAEDAPAQIELLEATAALHVRIGNAAEAESRATAAIERAPGRPRLYVVLSEARRALGNLEGAMAAVEAGLRQSKDTLLDTERGVVLAARGDLAAAEQAWRGVLLREPLSPAAFTNLASLAMGRRDAPLAQSLVDQVLDARGAHPEVLRRAIHLSLATEPDGIARAARVSALSGSLLEISPVDAWACLVLARAALEMGDKERALDHLRRVELLAPGSVHAAEALRGCFALTAPQAAMEIEAILRVAYTASAGELEVLSARARAIATLHDVWSTWFAVGVVERHKASWRAARDAFERAVSLSDGASLAHAELVGACVALGDGAAALHHASRVCALDGRTPQSLGVLAVALLANERRGEADDAISAALRLNPSDLGNAELAERIRRAPEPSSVPPGALARLWRRLLGS